MSAALPRRATLVWMGLTVATCATWWLGTDHPLAGTSLRLAPAMAIVIAFVKIYFVGQDFMELRTAPAVLRRSFAAWLVIVGLTTTTLYLL